MAASERVVAWLAAASVQFALLVLLLTLLDVALRRAWPQLRLVLWLLAFAKLAVPPDVASPVSLIRLAPEAGLARFAGPVADAPCTALAVAWLAGVAAVVALRIRGERRLARRVAADASRPPDRAITALDAAMRELRMKRRPRLVVTAAVAGPALHGLLRPAILLPPEWLDRGESLRHALLHELAHLKRRDPWTAFACDALRALFWFHPAVHFARARVAALLELCCDEAAAAPCDAAGDRAAYRRTLVATARDLLARDARPLLSMHSRAALLEQRLRRLDRPRHRRPATERACCAVAAAIMVACVLPMARVTGLDAAVLDAARATVGAAMRGERVGCLRLQYSVRALSLEHGPVPTVAMEGDPR